MTSEGTCQRGWLARRRIITMDSTKYTEFLNLSGVREDQEKMWKNPH